MESNESSWNDNCHSLNNASFPELSFFNNKKIDEGKFVIMKSTDTGKNFANLSPFWIQKGVDGITTDTTKIMKQKEGSLLIRTNTNKGTTKLLKAITFGGIINIKVEEHHSLNDRQGIIYCSDLNNEEINDILNELKDQNIKHVHAMTKFIDNKLCRMGLYVITFNSRVLPDFINIGYLKIKVRPYIPNPMKCRKCLAYGHTKNWCNKSEEFCNKCAQALPHDSCTEKLCKNCNGEHYSNFKKCPIYVKESKIMEIKTLQNVSINEAKRRHIIMFEQINKDSYVEVTENLNEHVMQQLEIMKKEIQDLKNKEIVNTEKLNHEIKRNNNLMTVNTNLIKKLKELEKINQELKKEKQMIKNELKATQVYDSMNFDTDEDEIDSSISEIVQKINKDKTIAQETQKDDGVKAGNSKRPVEERNSSEDNDVFKPTRKKVSKNKPRK